MKPRSRGRPRTYPESGPAHLNVKIQPELLARLQAACDARGVSKTAAVSAAIQMWLKKSAGR